MCEWRQKSLNWLQKHNDWGVSLFKLSIRVLALTLFTHSGATRWEMYDFHCVVETLPDLHFKKCLLFFSGNYVNFLSLPRVAFFWDNYNNLNTLIGLTGGAKNAFLKKFCWDAIIHKKAEKCALTGGLSLPLG